MSNITFGQIGAEESAPTVSEFKENKVGASYDLPDIEPVSSDNAGDVVLKSLGIDDNIRNLPLEDAENLTEVSGMLKDLIKDRGLKPVRASYDKILKDVMSDMGMDELNEPSAVLQKLGSVIKAYKSLAFIKNSADRRSIFMKLGRMKSTKEIDRAVMETVERSNIWR